ncbi:hypothetical protein CYA_2528 [Synechococcus sp. JA-3-3Ab]|nr:hypothetical protein CYA_2528 [Synechococcus sp. JA-3-3Ab]
MAKLGTADSQCSQFAASRTGDPSPALDVGFPSQ